MTIVAHQTMASWKALLNAEEQAPAASVFIAQDVLSPYRCLALTVIKRAFCDALMGACSSAERDSAREFLVGSPIMRHWCRVAGLDPPRVITLASHLERRGTARRGRSSLSRP
jgi:hypothetical protein